MTPCLPVRRTSRQRRRECNVGEGAAAPGRRRAPPHRTAREEERPTIGRPEGSGRRCGDPREEEGSPPLHRRTPGRRRGRAYPLGAGHRPGTWKSVRRPQGGGGGRRWSDRPREEVGPLEHRVEAVALRKKVRRHQGGGEVPPLLLRTPPGGGRDAPQETHLP